MTQTVESQSANILDLWPVADIKGRCTASEQWP